jgi:hypothetical protein
VTKLGGFIDFFDENPAQLVEPTIAYYVDNSRDMVCGEALMCQYVDHVEAIEAYYFNRDLRDQHGKQIRKNILTNYGWPALSEKLADICYKVTGRTVYKAVDLVSEVEKIDMASLVSASNTVATSSRLKKSKKSKKKSKRDEIKKLKEQLNKLLDDDDDSDSS